MKEDDDPEKRIGDLERQLAEPRAAEKTRADRGYPSGPASVIGGRLTPEQVRTVAFSKPPIGKRGYNEDEVDALLDRIQAALQDPAGQSLAAEQVRNVAFSKPPIGKRGYNEDEVDAFLDRAEAAMGSSQGGSPPPPQATFSAAPDGGGSPTRHARPESRSHRFQDNAFNIIGRIVDFITDPTP